ncbi:MAG: hypothetical protein B7Z80_04220 [Rhodospirillales bacterium 20-64-7]|nr:MAG: hypothetical protein B7Z80_04220 [Rhodospirillales bacterium 20-64-7]HQT76083.1 SDR family oxidoreductase [Rhodopila sp.]
MKLKLNGKVALVTGASRGIGAAIAAELAQEGMHLCLAARDQDKLREQADYLSGIHNIQTHVAAVDLRDPAIPVELVHQTIRHFGRLDVLVNNAGATKRADFFNLTDEDWEDGFALKFHGYVRMTRAAWPHLRETKGSVVNIVGIGARAGSAEFTVGGAVNVALLNFTKAMADIGIGHDVRVNAINPGLIETDRFTRNVERVMREKTIGRDEAIASLLTAYGTKRVGRPEEIGWLTAYLASDRAAFIQGAVLDIDGGATRSL